MAIFHWRLSKFPRSATPPFYLSRDFHRPVLGKNLNLPARLQQASQCSGCGTGWLVCGVCLVSSVWSSAYFSVIYLLLPSPTPTSNSTLFHTGSRHHLGWRNSFALILKNVWWWQNTWWGSIQWRRDCMRSLDVMSRRSSSFRGWWWTSLTQR